MKVPEWVDLVKTNNRFVLKLFLRLLSSLSRAQVIELLFTGRSLPPMMRIGSTSAQLPWPATCTSGLASFYTFCAPYRSQTEPCVLLGHNVGNSIFPKRSRIGQNCTLLDYPRGKKYIRRLASVFLLEG